MEMPVEIIPNTPVEVTRTEYDFITTRLAGRVFHNKSADGKYYVMSIGILSSQYIMDIFKHLRKII